MKKTLLFIFICTLLLSMASCGKGNDKASANNSLSETGDSSGQTNTEAALDTDTSANSDLSKTSPVEKNVETTMKRLINATDGVKIESLTVMGTGSTSDSNNYKVYAIVTWNRKHSPTDSQQMIQTYSDNLAGSADAKLGTVEGLSLVWLVPNLNGAASIAYEKTDGMLSLKEAVFDKSFGVSSDGTTDSALGSSGAALNTGVTGSAVTN